jgi:hypothetical protein
MAKILTGALTLTGIDLALGKLSEEVINGRKLKYDLILNEKVNDLLDMRLILMKKYEQILKLKKVA